MAAYEAVFGRYEPFMARSVALSSFSLESEARMMDSACRSQPRGCERRRRCRGSCLGAFRRRSFSMANPLDID